MASKDMVDAFEENCFEIGISCDRLHLISYFGKKTLFVNKTTWMTTYKKVEMGFAVTASWA